jgi:hypothetical protein
MLLRIFSILTALVLFLSIILSPLGSITGIAIQTAASASIVLGSILELCQILIVLHLANKQDKIGHVLHRFAYMTMLVMIYSFLSIVGGTFLASFSLSGGDAMILAVVGYVVQASFGICLSILSYYFLQIEDT